jgi:hypothetical protein
MSSEIYEWYISNGDFDLELLSLMQRECFNKPVTPARTISWQELSNILNRDKRFNGRLALRWWWIFDEEYTVADRELITKILNEIRDIDNVWTVVAIAQAVTGLNCGFVGKGRRIVNGVITEEEIDVYGFIIDDNGETKLIVFDSSGKEMTENDVVIGFMVFD